MDRFPAGRSDTGPPPSHVREAGGRRRAGFAPNIFPPAAVRRFPAIARKPGYLVPGLCPEARKRASTGFFSAKSGDPMVVAASCPLCGYFPMTDRGAVEAFTARLFECPACGREEIFYGGFYPEAPEQEYVRFYDADYERKETYDGKKR